jgi:ABC-type phosphate transport system substrate-binding protein
VRNPVRNVAIAAVAAAAMLVPMTQSASAGTTNFKLNSVGSDVTYCLSNAVDNAYKAAVAATSGNVAVDTPPLLSTNIGCKTTPATFTVPVDSVHAKIVYNATNPPPSGSGAGITAFIADNGAGNIAFVRSTSGRKSTFPANLEFWAYGLDAVSWVHFTTNTSAPKSLTTAQFQGIYNCTFTNWSQVGGKNAPITRYYPLTTSGTAAFFAQVFLGGAEPVSTTACPITFVAQNDATQVLAANKTTAVLPYSFANFHSQTHRTAGEVNLALGTVLGNVNGVVPNSTTISEAAAFANVAGDACTAAPVPGQFCASRYIYNVTSQALPAAYYAAVIDLIGVPSTGIAGNHSLCSNIDAAKLTAWGFKPLAQASTAQSTSSDPVPGASFCRQF